MRFISIRVKILLSSSLIILFAFAIIIIGYFQFIESKQFTDDIIPLSNNIVLIAKLETSTDTLEYNIDQYLVTKGDENKDFFIDELSTLNRNIENLMTDNIFIQSINSIKEMIKKIENDFSLISSDNFQKSPTRNRLIYSLYSDIKETKSQLNNIMESNILSMKSNVINQQDIIKSALKTFLFLGAMMIVVYLILGFRTSISIPRSILKLKNASSEITAGNFNVKAEVHSSDEVEQLAQIFNKMTNTISNNIDQLKCNEEELKKSLKTKNVLLAEIHHRIKNNLQIVSSIIQIEAGNTNNREVLKHLQNTALRIDAMGLVHKQLYN